MLTQFIVSNFSNSFSLAWLSRISISAQRVDVPLVIWIRARTLCRSLARDWDLCITSCLFRNNLSSLVSILPPAGLSPWPSEDERRQGFLGVEVGEEKLTLVSDTVGVVLVRVVITVVVLAPIWGDDRCNIGPGVLTTTAGFPAVVATETMTSRGGACENATALVRELGVGWVPSGRVVGPTISVILVVGVAVATVLGVFSRSNPLWS